MSVGIDTTPGRGLPPLRIGLRNGARSSGSLCKEAPPGPRRTAGCPEVNHSRVGVQTGPHDHLRDWGPKSLQGGVSEPSIYASGMVAGIPLNLCLPERHHCRAGILRSVHDPMGGRGQNSLQGGTCTPSLYASGMVPGIRVHLCLPEVPTPGRVLRVALKTMWGPENRKHSRAGPAPPPYTPPGWCPGSRSRAVRSATPVFQRSVTPGWVSRVTHGTMWGPENRNHSRVGPPPPPYTPPERCPGSQSRAVPVPPQPFQALWAWLFPALGPLQGG